MVGEFTRNHRSDGPHHASILVHLVECRVGSSESNSDYPIRWWTSDEGFPRRFCRWNSSIFQEFAYTQDRGCGIEDFVVQ